MKDSNQCPRYRLSDEARDWFPLYKHYAAGHLYCAGGIREQPAVYLEAMRLIDGAVKEAQSEAYSQVQN